MFMHETLQVETGCKFYFDLLSCQLVMLLIQNEEEIVAGKKKQDMREEARRNVQHM
jgi:hypothetical protein